MFQRGGIAALALMLLAAAGTASAAAAVPGTVVDETGNPVAGARVTATAGGESFAATTNASGVFTLNIPAAGDYEIRVEREGFFLLTNRQTRLDPSTPLDVHLTHLKELAESIDVPYSPPVVDPGQTDEVKRLDGQTILNLPYAASQDYRRALQLMPGAIQDNGGQVHFNGGTPDETNYRLDGFDISNAATGGLTARLSVDTVQAVEWTADRMPAEDKGSAGTVEVRTEMGDDRWRFGATNPIPSFDTAGGVHVNHWSPRLMFSGPLKKGKIWFHTALDPFYTADTIPGLPRGQDRTSNFTGSDLSRFQWNVSDWQTLTASFLYNRGDELRNGLSTLNPAETTVNGRSSLGVAAIRDQFIVNGSLIEAGFASTWDYSRTSPLGSAAYLMTPFGSSGNFFRDEAMRATRQEGIASANFRQLGSSFGTHQIRAGADVENSDLRQTIVRHPLSVVRADNSVVRSVEFEGPARAGAGNLEVHSYVADHWTPVPSLTFDLGLRTQWNRITGVTPPAPRLGAAWAPVKSGRLKFSAGWGVYYDSVTLSMLALGEDQTSVTTFYSPAGVPQGAALVSAYLVNRPDLRTPRFTVTSVSAEGMLPWRFVGRVDLLSRQGSRGFAFDQMLSSPVLNEYVANNSGHARYRSAEFSVRRTFLSKYQWSASYTRSSARSNAAVAYTIENPLLTAQAGGPQPWDAPNRFLVWGWLPVSRKWFPGRLRPIVGDTDFQLLGDYHTGFPFNSTTENGYLFGAPDSLRFPAYFSVSVAIERRFHFHGYLWAWRVGLINALGSSNPNVVNSDADSPQYLTFAPGQARAVNVRLRFLGRK